MDITPSPEFCAACRIVLGGDTPKHFKRLGGDRYQLVGG